MIQNPPTSSESASPPPTEIAVAPATAEGERLDKFLSRLHPEKSRAFIQKCIAEQRVRLDGQSTAAALRLRPGASIEIDWPAPGTLEPSLRPEAIPFEILFEDQDLIVLDKPPGLVVHPNRNDRQGTLVHGLLHHDQEVFGDLPDQDLRPGIVHRLDKETSGALVVAKTAEAWTRLKASFKQRKVEKTYLAIVVGEFGATVGRVEGMIGRHPRNRKKMAVVQDNGKPAATRYRVLAAASGATLLEVDIETGRTHQIRVHFSHLRHPVLGDRVYGGRPSIEGIDPPRQMLHAWRLSFPHPRTGALREYTAPIPADFREIMRQLGLVNSEHLAAPETER